MVSLSSLLHKETTQFYVKTHCIVEVIIIHNLINFTTILKYIFVFHLMIRSLWTTI